MKLLVIGASGLIGQAVYHLAKCNGIDVIGTEARSRHKELYSFRLGIDHLDDLLSEINFRQQEKDSFYVVIAGAITNINQCYGDQTTSRLVNVIGTKKLLFDLSSRGIKSLFLSTDAVFDGEKGNYSEEDAVNPLSVYGEQKAEMEEYIVHSLPNVLIYRLAKQFCCTYNEGVRNLFQELYDQGKSGGIVRCIKGLRFNPTDIYDTAQAIILGLRLNLKGIYHVAAPKAYTRYEIAKLFFSMQTKKPIIEYHNLSEFKFIEEKPLDTSLNVNKFFQSTKYGFRRIEVSIEYFYKNMENGI